ncbi:uncharacterized protein LOC129801898 [Phlebotomus papatasi]|uniref:uncharacterized protein LOC129801898 n=1 Tax=Phlebotomus papatasi TaxID=29031 RepID=UPI0024837F63|nr:uncharacterized protein LOC129801898 [Phlebotomus papatasi]
MPLIRANFLLNLLTIIQEKELDDLEDVCLEISLGNFLHIHFPLKEYLCDESETCEGRKCLFYLPENNSQDIQLTINLQKTYDCHEESLACYTTDFTSILEKILNNHKEKSTCETCANFPGSTKSCSSSDFPFERKICSCSEVIMRLIPLFGCGQRSLGFLAITMTFTSLGLTLVENFTAKPHEGYTECSECGEQSPESTICDCFEESCQGSCDCTATMLSPKMLIIQEGSHGKVWKVPCACPTETRGLRKIPNYKGLPKIKGNAKYPDYLVNEIQEEILNNKKPLNKVRTQIPDEVFVEIQRGPHCSMRSCQSFEFAWELPELPCKKIRTTETQVEEEYLMEKEDSPNTTNVLKSVKDQDIKKGGTKKKRREKTGRKARKQKM